MLQHSLTDMSRRSVTCYQHCTSLTPGKELAQAQSSGADKGSHKGVVWYVRCSVVDILMQPAPQCGSSHQRVSLFRATVASQRSNHGILKNTPALLFLRSKPTVFTR